MKKKLVALLMAFVSCFSLGATAFAAENPEQTFKDVSPDDWYYEGVEYVNDLGIMTGLGDESEGYFKPDEYLQRQDLALILARFYKKYINSELNLDESKEAYYEDAVTWVKKYNVMTGYGSGDFGIGNAIIRQDMVVALFRYQNTVYNFAYDTIVPDLDNICDFPDNNEVDGYAVQALYRYILNGIIQGEGTDFKILNPHGKVTRGMAAVILQRFMERYKDYLLNGFKDLL